MTVRDPLWRNLGILAVLAALLTAAGQGGRVAGILFVVLRVLFLLVLVGIAFSVWRQNRGTFGLMPLRSRVLLYGSAIGLVLLIATGGSLGRLLGAGRAALLRAAVRLRLRALPLLAGIPALLLLKLRLGFGLHRPAGARRSPGEVPCPGRILICPDACPSDSCDCLRSRARASCRPPRRRRLRR